MKAETKEIKIEIEVPGGEEKEKDFDEWQIKDALATLVRAEEIKADKALLAAVAEYSQGVKKVIKTVEGLKKKAKELRIEAESEEE